MIQLILQAGSSFLVGPQKSDFTSPICLVKKVQIKGITSGVEGGVLVIYHILFMVIIARSCQYYFGAPYVFNRIQIPTISSYEWYVCNLCIASNSKTPLNSLLKSFPGIYKALVTFPDHACNFQFWQSAAPSTQDSLSGEGVSSDEMEAWTQEHTKGSPITERCKYVYSTFKQRAWISKSGIWTKGVEI